MSRFESKKLIYILGILVLFLIFTLLVKVPRKSSTLARDIVKFDTSQVVRIVITPRTEEGKEFEFIKEKDGWKIRQGNITSVPRTGAVSNILNDLINIKPSGLAAVGKSQWSEYNVTDSLGIRVRAENKKGKVLTDVILGKFSYKPVNNPYGGYGGGSVDGTSYVRLADDDKVYAVDGFLVFSFTGGFNDWRDRTLIHATRSDITKISFTFPADSGYVLEKIENKWHAAGQPADSTKVSDYLSDIVYTDGDTFDDDFKPVAPPEYKIDIEGNNLLNISIKCYKGEGGVHILNSSINPDSYFISDSAGIFSKIFKPLTYFRGESHR